MQNCVLYSCLGLKESQSFGLDFEIMVWQLCLSVITFVELATLVANFSDIKALSALEKDLV